MTLKVTISAEPNPAQRAVFRVESIDDSGHATTYTPWRMLPHGAPVENYVHSYQRVVVEEYDEARHGEVKEMVDGGLQEGR